MLQNNQTFILDRFFIMMQALQLLPFQPVDTIGSEAIVIKFRILVRKLVKYGVKSLVDSPFHLYSVYKVSIRLYH